jgi:hypothetical protein
MPLPNPLLQRLELLQQGRQQLGDVGGRIGTARSIAV